METDDKVENHINAGFKPCWGNNPEARMVLFFRAGGSVTKLREKD